MAYICDVSDLSYRIPVVLERPTQDIGEDVRPEVADVGVAVDRGSARVHLDAAWFQRLKLLHLSAERVHQKERKWWMQRLLLATSRVILTGRAGHLELECERLRGYSYDDAWYVKPRMAMRPDPTERHEHDPSGRIIYLG